MSLSAIKHLTISLGIYKPARAIHRLLTREDLSGHRRLLAEFINPGDLAFDVGANIGARSELMLDLGARVVAFEPQPDLAREVRARGNRITVVQSAVGARPGSAELFLTTSTGMASLKPNWQLSNLTGKIAVPVTTLDAEISKHGVPSFCKIDVEGFEVEVLKGLSTPIRALSIEYHCDVEGIAKISECLRHLSKLDSYEFNLVGTEDSDWLLPRWMDQDEFLQAFPKCAAPHHYGDIFARMRKARLPCQSTLAGVEEL
ncbi:FkbM family methyltransferase [Bradyrhizobium sp. AS23.2]|uniref:FkbM family methyltransferase n=1 Tax=Bradyrhizobium sp. AS23.2 TaxID=1680155 RepID=UPI00093FBA2E|nr:FkbM family methyltransferase [Bradyrhizobium sp. AS23.2]